MKIKLVIVFVFLLMVYPTFALDYTVDVNSPSKVNVYEGEPIENTFSTKITNNADYCDITCDWHTSMNTVGTGVKVEHGGKTNDFYFDLKAEGINGIASYTLTVTCDRITSITCWSSPDEWTSNSYSFTFLHNKDGICTTEREKCDNYLDFLKDPACSCPSDKECKPNSERGTDNRGCATFCGNKKVEKQYENCKNCPIDVGKCDGEYCKTKSECEGDYCVHNVCSHTSYRRNDGYCDSNVGENCKNSASDCACESYERCNPTGKCENYCGNGICEASEQGVCKADCQWCGDGICDEDKETCKGCPQDCGECEKTEEEEQLTQQLTQIREEAKASAQKTQTTKKTLNITIGSVLGIIFLVVIVWIIFRLTKSKKEKIGKRHKKTEKK